jgi:signal transduction histidine kinase
MNVLAVRDPAPIAGVVAGLLVGIGVGIVIGARYVRIDDVKAQLDDMQVRMRSMMDETQSRMRSMMDETRTTVDERSSQLRDALSSAASRAEETVARVQKAAGPPPEATLTDAQPVIAGDSQPRP